MYLALECDLTYFIYHIFYFEVCVDEMACSIPQPSCGLKGYFFSLATRSVLLSFGNER